MLFWYFVASNSMEKIREDLLVAEYMFFYAVLTDLARHERHLEMLYKAVR